MKKNSSIILIVSIIIIAILLAGMIVSTALLSVKKNVDWEYIPKDSKTDYRGNGSTEDSFNYANEFKEAIKGYLSKSAINYLGLGDDFDQRSERILVAMQEAGIPASKLKTITNVIKENRLPKLLNNVDIPFTTVEEFSFWCDERILSITDESMFSIIGSFVHSFLNVTTLTEEELAGFLYYYLDKNASPSYKLTLQTYEKDDFITFFSDTFFAIRVLSQTKNKTGVEFGTDALRSAMYQLGCVYLDITELSDYVSLYKIFGFPDEFPIDESDENAENMSETYHNLTLSIGKVVYFLGLVMTDMDNETLSSFLMLNNFNRQINVETGLENQKAITVLTEEELTENITPEREIVLQKLLSERNYYQIITAQNFSKKINDALDIMNETYEDDTLYSFIDLIMNMRVMIFYLSQESMTITALENFQVILTNIMTYSTELQDSITYFQDKNYTLDEIKKENDITELSLNASYFSDGGKLMELYVSSMFNIWLTYKVNEWGILKNG